VESLKSAETITASDLQSHSELFPGQQCSLNGTQGYSADLLPLSNIALIKAIQKMLYILLDALPWHWKTRKW
jgi:hypothetical protein